MARAGGSASGKSGLGTAFHDGGVAPVGESDLADLRDSFHFDPARAEIRLGKRRMLLVDDIVLGQLRRELVRALGYESARMLMSRIGYGTGVADAQLAQELRHSGTLEDIYRAGPQFHALKGAVQVEELAFEADFEAGRFHGEYVWHNSAECASHVQEMGIGAHPAGWQQAGYASGYASTFFGRPMVFRELECIAMGHDRCYLVGRPADEWPDADNELRWFRADTYSRRPPPPDSAAPVDADLHIGARAIVGASSGFNTVLHLVDKVAPTMAPVLFLGESGVGKEVFARELHKRSRRADRPIVAVNCAAIPETLLEAELFGVEKGAFTGAIATRPGRFERAAGGTLFLDEIGTLSLAAQGKLLRVLQDGDYERVGGTRTLTADVRLIAATNADLRAEMEAGRFRADLFHRLSPFPVYIPPLRERRADIPVLANHFLARLCQRHGRGLLRLEAEVVRAFHDYGWPGNIREMENLVERGVILAGEGEAIGLHHLTLGVGNRTEGFVPDPFRDFVARRFRGGGGGAEADVGAMLLDSGLSRQEIADRLIAAALERSGGNASAAAAALGMTRAQVQYWKGRRGG
ncbi:sigma-54-dependent Fis family transcriptional regulator [Sphingobium sp. TA15]|uniref:Putative transcriptional regulator n=1 Tax=Sphingobium indicum (strain DSM 16413 / CCM 7287 / MTCC 6362 / UT26 / NBRC 101211 / UT26S) TaxID=452662 RepID=D4Z086_SPHIU|nr:sigma-54-dependent Fis family transcriptional regulator [Sphingobium indicum]BAI96018.1 putative transcriptional regulator [Sphingobium indicum UT26S]BDD65327.1 sigma-54-dependent Fis family transcriptional regulator [Sphingobium sp. TA15]